MKITATFIILILNLIFVNTTLALEETRPAESVSLAVALNIALKNNDEVNALENEVRASEAGLQKAKAAYLFNLSATGEVSQVKTFPTPASPFGSDSPLANVNLGMNEDVTKSLSLSFVQPIYSFGLIPSSVKVAQENLNSKRNELDLKKHEISLSVIQSFYGAYLAEQTVKIREDEVSRSQLALDNANQKFEAGQSPKFDVIRSEVTLAQAREQLVLSKKNAQSSLLSFQRLLGNENNYIPDFPSDLKVSEWTIPVEECVKLAYEQRPELKQLQNGIKAQDAVVAINRLRPNLNFMASLKYADQSSSPFTGKNSWGWFFQLTMPVFDGGKAKNAVSEAKSKRDALVNRYDDLTMLIQVDVKTNYLALEESKARIESSSKILDQAKEALFMAEEGYKEGVVTYLDLVSSRNQYTQAQLNNLAAKTEYNIAFAKLLKSIGQMPFMTSGELPDEDTIDTD